MMPYATPDAMLEDEFLTTGVLTRRIFAWLIDAVLIAMLVGIAWSFGVLLGVLTLGLAMPLLGGLPALPILYTWLWLASPLSATPGQALLGLTVCRDDDLGPPSVLQALVSAIGYYVTIALGAIWLLVALLTTRRRTLHDLVSGLVVVRRRALTPPAGGWNMPGGGWTPR
ncbi:MAG TPA: RDD family protein [Acetobacteraceae bacterium]|jgi:uncharacterized RDD family membrane protein YckC|nr:RDD family protein [Acetobacteraceae bacterium]